MPLKILLTGKYGQVGWELHRALLPLGEVIAVDSADVDLVDEQAIRGLVRQTRPNLIINPAAYTAVDRAEAEPDVAFAINRTAPAILAEEAARLGAGLIHYSTDYVFDGAQNHPYTEADLPNPLNVYGRSKLAGEQAVAEIGGAYLTLRTSWVYSTRRDSFVTKVLGWARQHPTLRVVADQVGCPTWSRALAEITALLVASGGKDPVGLLRANAGVYHLAGSGHASRYEWAQAILRCDPDPASQVTRELLPARTLDFPAPAPRPLNAALDCARFTDAFGLRLPDWEMALALALQP